MPGGKRGWAIHSNSATKPERERRNYCDFQCDGDRHCAFELSMVQGRNQSGRSVEFGLHDYKRTIQQWRKLFSGCKQRVRVNTQLECGLDCKFFDQLRTTRVWLGELVASRERRERCDRPQFRDSSEWCRFWGG